MISQQGTNTSAFTKLTSKLNLLKVGRSQAANEMHNVDRGRESSHSSRNQDKGKGSDVPNPEKRSSKGKSNPDSAKLKKSDSQPGYHSDGWDQHLAHLERGKSEGRRQSCNVDKGR